MRHRIVKYSEIARDPLFGLDPKRYLVEDTDIKSRKYLFRNRPINPTIGGFAVMLVWHAFGVIYIMAAAHPLTIFAVLIGGIIHGSAIAAWR